ncbi:unnamed protein product [Enterobius vermicularis]|uniref:Ovule protein n=1 Tax=Enterobius vermicularis TaxID=51028 RepID=A0A0N4UZW2_ENTVE|nr:unnamed protein product [Enterobius vermicularis]
MVQYHHTSFQISLSQILEPCIPYFGIRFPSNFNDPSTTVVPPKHIGGNKVTALTASKVQVVGITNKEAWMSKSSDIAADIHINWVYRFLTKRD